jgi:disulfide bond formation protein DsbB
MMQQFSSRRLLGGVALLAGALLASGFILEHGLGVLPCPMCWWQRYAHAAIAVVAGLGVLLKQEKLGAAGAGLAAAGGFGVAAWQVAAQQGWLPYPPSCAGEGNVGVMGADLLAQMANTQVVPCDLETFTLFGLSLAAWNLPAMLVVLGVSTKLWFDSR